MATQPLIGNFYFTYLGYGCISGLYHNNIDMRPFTESSKRKVNRPDSCDTLCNFEGEYKTIWMEGKLPADKCNLQILRLDENTFRLKWSDDKKHYYDGIGFVVDDKLIGAYWIPSEQVPR